VTEALTNPLALVPVGNLSAGEYVVRVSVERFSLTYDAAGQPVYAPIKAPAGEIWEARFRIDAA
jgi:hypothetical protein